MTAELHDDTEGDLDVDLAGPDVDLDEVAEAWVVWCRAHRLYEPVSAQVAALARRGSATRPLRAKPAVTISAVSLAAFHVAYSLQPDALDKQIFALYYVARVRPIKAAAAALGIGRAQFYRVLGEFRRRVGAAGRALEGQASREGQAAPGGYTLSLLASHSGSDDVKREIVSP